jgi:hypothetical protein
MGLDPFAYTSLRTGGIVKMIEVMHHTLNNLGIVVWELDMSLASLLSKQVS